MGSEETHPTSSIHEEIPATSVDEPAAADPQTAPVEEQEIPQPEEPELAIPEVVMQLTDTLCQSQRIRSQGSKSSRLKTSLASMYSSLITTHMTLLA